MNRRRTRSRADENRPSAATAVRESLGTDSAFLIDFGLPTPARRAICAKFFHSAFRCEEDGLAIEKHAQPSQISFVRCITKQNRRLQIMLILSAFFVRRRDGRAMKHHAFASLRIVRAPRAEARRTGAERAVRTRFVKRRLFFSLCCSKRNAVRAQFATALDDIRHVTWLGGQQWRNVERRRRRQRRRRRPRRPRSGRRGSSLPVTSRSSHFNVSKIASYGPGRAVE